MTRKTKIFFWASAFICIAAVSAMLFLFSGRDAGTSFFKTELEGAVGALSGWSLETDGISGNPVTGFHASNVRISFEGTELARAKRLSVTLSLLALLRGNAGLDKVTVQESSLSGEGLLNALRRSDFSPDSAAIPGFVLPVILFSPVTITTPLGNLDLKSLRLTPGQDTMTFHGQGYFLDFPVEAGASFTTGDQLSITDGFLRGGGSVVSFSGPVFPETSLEGIISDLRLDVISELTNLPFTTKGSVDSTLHIERPNEKFLISGEGRIDSGDIWDLLIDGSFFWSADEEKAVLSPVETNVFSSSTSGMFALFFGEEPRTEIALSISNMKLKEWERCFPWLSFAHGTLSALKLNLYGPFEHLDGSISFNAPSIEIQGVPVEAPRGELQLMSGEKMLLKGAGKWAGSLFSFSGESILNAPGGISTKISLFSTNFDLKAAGEAYAPVLSAQGKGALELSVSIPPTEGITFGGTVSVPKASLFGTSGERLSLAFSGNPERVELPSLSFSPSVGGTISGKGFIAEIGGNNPAISLEGAGQNIPWSLLNSMIDGNLQMGGLFDLSWGVKGPLSAPSTFFELKGRDLPLMKDLPLRNVVLDGRVEGETLSLTTASGRLFGGTVSLDGSARLGRNPALSFKGTYRDFSANQIAAFAGADPDTAGGLLAGDFSLSGTPSSPSLALTVSSPSLTVLDLPVSALNTQLEGSFSSLAVTNFSARFLDAPLTASGAIGLSAGERTNLKMTVRNLDLHGISTAFFPETRFLGGDLNAELSVTGRAGGDFSFLASGTSPFLSFQGVLLENATASLKPDGKNAFSLSLEGLLGESTLAVGGRMVLSPSGPAFNLKNTKKLDLGKTLAALSTQTAGIFDGDIDFRISGQLGSSPFFEGEVTSSSLGFYRTEAQDVSVPFTWKDNTLLFSDGKALYHGGKTTFSGRMDPMNMRWEGNLAVNGMDLASASERLLEGEGKISGNADLTLRGSGTGGMLGLVFGSGQISAREGSVSGFEAINAVSNTGEIRFSSVLASFNMDGRNVYLLPGSRISAPPGDNVYRYFSASGSLGWNDTPIDLRCVGDINVRALNAFLGALQGLITIDGNPLADPQFLQRFLTGIVGGMTLRDFRETSFNIKGTWDSPELLDLKVSQGSAPLVLPPSNPGRNETRIKITVEIPTGSGKDTSTSPEDQVRKQLLEQIMKSIIRPGTPEEN